MKIFRPATEIPEYDRRIVAQFEDGHYEDYFYWAVLEKDLLKYFKGTKFSGPAIRWCYIEDLDKIE